MRECFRRCCFGLLAIAAAWACDTTVTNPGPVRDEFLVDTNIYFAAVPMVNGSGRALGDAMNYIGYTGAAVAREIHPAGSTGSFGITPRWQRGELSETDGDLNAHWNRAHRARWLAEETIRRLVAPGPPPPGRQLTVANYHNLLQLAYVYAGFANRLLGENMCQAVFDGGAAQPNADYFTRAEEHFTKAIAVTGGTAATIQAQATAAYAGRAAVRVFLGKWTEAVDDAGRVPLAYVMNMPYYNIGEDAQRNRIAWAIGNTPYRAHTQWSTWHYDYRTASNDPRVPITVTTMQGDAAIECCGRVPFYPEAKHPTSASPIRLTSGREMRLIEAENHLRNGNVANGMLSINQVRTAAGAGTITALDLTDAWRLLKRERGIELWLEARRLGDLRRWSPPPVGSGAPGALDPLEQPGALSHLTRQDLCFPIPPSERQTNPNLRS